MKLNESIVKAMNKAIESYGNRYQLSLRVGIPQQTLKRWAEFKVENINDDSFTKILPYLKPFLDPQEYASYVKAYEINSVESTVRISFDTKTGLRDKQKNSIRKTIPLTEDGDFKCAENESMKMAQSFIATRKEVIANTAELRECIKDAMLAKGVRSAVDLCRLIGYDSVNTLKRLLAGSIAWFPDVLSAVLDALEIDHDDAPISAEERALLSPQGVFRDGAMLVRPIPVVEWANAAEAIAGFIDSGATVMTRWDPATTEVIPAPMGVRKGTMALRVHGESMEPKILDGDKIFVEPADSLETIPDKKVVVVKFTPEYPECPECVVCKRFRRFRNGICLTSDNASGRTFDDLRPQDIAWIGVVVAKYSNDL